MTEAVPAPSHHRLDIQALRGLAVLVVILFHARLDACRSGYLGVDMFFVISGFLITTQIRDAIDAGRFRLQEFYLRRAKRLLPAAYAVFLVTTLAAPLVLGPGEMDDYVAQLMGALTFSANFVLWRQSGYFDGAAELKPLLHTWSLAIEEQFYLLLPAALVILPRRRWAGALGAALCASLALLFALSDRVLAPFYLLPTRAWELLLGVLAALVPLGPRGRRIARVGFWPALLALCSVSALSLRWGGLDLGVFVACFATLTVIIAEHEALAGGRLVRAFGLIGDRSYALYLVHWPLLALFANGWFGEGAGVGPRLLVVLAGGAVAEVLLRTIETPFRFRQVDRPARFWVTLVAVPLLLVVLAVGLRGSMRAHGGGEALRPNRGLAETCDASDTYVSRPECQSAPEPTVLVWGDSHAMHLVPGLVEGGAPALVQATRSACAPLVGVAAFDAGVTRPTSNSRQRAASCLRFNESVLAYLAGAPSIGRVVLSGSLGDVLGPESRLLVSSDPSGALRVEEASARRVKEGLAAAAARVRSLGKRVVVVSSPPRHGVDVGRCADRERLGLPIWGSAGCEIPRPRYEVHQAQALGLLEELRREGATPVVGMEPWLCDETRCLVSRGGQAIYRDEAHLSVEGSRWLLGPSGLGAAVLAAAR